MLLIGERINGMFKNVKQAIQERDKKVIQQLAQSQIEAGADYLDVNVGPATGKPVEAVEWLVNTIQEVGEYPLSIDSPKLEVIEAGLKLCKAKPMINSTTAEIEKLNSFLAVAKKYNAKIIGLTMNEKGVPGSAAGRTELALQLLASATEYDMPMEDVYIDPLILPVNVAQDVAGKVLEAIIEIKKLADPSPQVLLGLSNVSQKCNHRQLVNRTYMVMAMAVGLNAGIVDVNDQELMDSIITARLLLNQDIYCDSFLEAYRKRKAGVC